MDPTVMNHLLDGYNLKTEMFRKNVVVIARVDSPFPYQVTSLPNSDENPLETRMSHLET
jgi:hypothetical protein